MRESPSGGLRGSPRIVRGSPRGGSQLELRGRHDSFLIADRGAETHESQSVRDIVEHEATGVVGRRRADALALREFDPT